MHFNPLNRFDMAAAMDMDKSAEKQAVDPEAFDEALRVRAATLTNEPGVYLFRSAGGRVLYVGKALDLRKRVQTYFKAGRPQDPKTRVLMTKVVAFETIVTRTEKESLILESNLIKKHRPRYNVLLKDDKRYPSLRLDVSQPFADLKIVRKIKSDGALYFGPHASGAAVKQTLKFIHKTFKLRKCSTRTFQGRTRPCLNFQMGLCLAPCTRDVRPEVYQGIVKEVIAFLRGRTPELIRKIKSEMRAAALRQAYEKAAMLRDKMQALEKTLERQVMVTSDFKDRDVVALIREAQASMAVMFRVRGGFLLGSRPFYFESAVGSDEEQMDQFLRQFYIFRQTIPAEVLVSCPPENHPSVEELLSEMRGGKVTIRVPLRGEKARLLEMALQNARSALRSIADSDAFQIDLLKRLQERLRMERVPLRIECFDNSNLFGTHQVAAMVVFQKGRPYRDDYRRYKLKKSARHDDYESMAEVLTRRYSNDRGGMAQPDLLLVDGGKGQLNVALAVLEELGIENRFSVAAIAKKEAALGETADKIYLPRRANPVQFGKQADLLLFLQRIRDEAHRAAITYQRKRRGSKALVSVLDGISGVGPKRKQELLKHFGGIDKIATASTAQLSRLPGISESLARTIRRSLKARKRSNLN